MAGIHESENFIVRYLAVERGNEAPETVFANGRVDLLFFHRADLNIGEMQPVWAETRAETNASDLVDSR